MTAVPILAQHKCDRRIMDFATRHHGPSCGDTLVKKPRERFVNVQEYSLLYTEFYQKHPNVPRVSAQTSLLECSTSMHESNVL